MVFVPRQSKEREGVYVRKTASGNTDNIIYTEMPPANAGIKKYHFSRSVVFAQMQFSVIEPHCK
jgi:hypothetical protein